MGMYYSTREVLRTKVFQVQLVIGMCVNFGVNFGFEWATLSEYGKTGLHPMQFWTMNAASTSVVADVIITTFLVGYLSVTLATWGIKVRATGGAVM